VKARACEFSVAGGVKPWGAAQDGLDSSDSP